MRMISAATAATLSILVAACSHPTDPSPIVIAPQTDPPAITCPAPVTAQSFNGQPVPVTFDAPTVLGGAIPVTTTCTATSGSSFPVGTSDVSCTARDNQQREASCSFAITVLEAPHISVSRIVAFGDSITAGRDGACLVTSSLPGHFDPFVVDRYDPYDVLVATPYPTALQELLRARYPAEQPTVTNLGKGGETAENGDARLSFELSSAQPQVVLLLEGINDIHNAAPQGDGVSEVRDGIQSMVRHSKEAGAEVFVSTLLPERREACKAYDYFDGVDDISEANAYIRSVAAQEGATLIDMYQVFLGQEGTLLGLDGLHPSQAGYLKMADTFFEAIKSRFEVP